MESITGKQFLDDFAEVMRAGCNDEKALRKFTALKEWTDFITGTVLSEIGVRHGYTEKPMMAKEYQHTDMAYFSSPAPGEPHYGEGHFWNFDAAIEHENNGHTWLNEFKKLIQISCGLKVIITYKHDDQSGGSLFGKAEEIYAYSTYHNPSEEWLIIIGPSEKERSEHEGDFRAYLPTTDGGRINMTAAKEIPMHIFQPTPVKI